MNLALWARENLQVKKWDKHQKKFQINESTLQCSWVQFFQAELHTSFEYLRVCVPVPDWLGAINLGGLS